MKMKHHFNVIMDAVNPRLGSEPELVKLAEDALLRAIQAGGYGDRPVEVTYVETFDSESPEEIRTHALVQDAMDSMEASGEGWKK